MVDVKKYPYDMDNTSVATARDWILTAMTTKDGAECPCCSRLVKVYRRKLYASMSYALMFFTQATRHSDEFVYVPQVFAEIFDQSVARGGDFVKLTYWNLIESNGVPGWYRVTQRGKDFVDCRIAIPKSVEVLDGALVSTDSDVFTIVDALGKHHNYEELLKAWPTKKRS